VNGRDDARIDPLVHVRMQVKVINTYLALAFELHSRVARGIW